LFTSFFSLPCGPQSLENLSFMSGQTMWIIVRLDHAKSTVSLPFGIRLKVLGRRIHCCSCTIRVESTAIAANEIGFSAQLVHLRVDGQVKVCYLNPFEAFLAGIQLEHLFNLQPRSQVRDAHSTLILAPN
jgi:hypothetical protein